MNTYIVTNPADYIPNTEKVIRGTLRYYLEQIAFPKRIILNVPLITLRANLIILNPYFHIQSAARTKIKCINNSQIANFTHHWIVQNIHFEHAPGNRNCFLLISSGCTDGLIRNCHAEGVAATPGGDSGEQWGTFGSPNRIRWEYCTAKGDHWGTMDTGDNLSFFRCTMKDCAIRLPNYRGPGTLQVEECDISVLASGTELLFDTVAKMNIINNIYRGIASFDYYPARVNVGYTGSETDRIYKIGNLWFPTPSTTAEFKFGVAGQTAGQAIPDTVYSSSPFTCQMPDLTGVPV